MLEITGQNKLQYTLYNYASVCYGSLPKVFTHCVISFFSNTMLFFTSANKYFKYILAVYCSRSRLCRFVPSALIGRRSSVPACAGRPDWPTLAQQTQHKGTWQLKLQLYSSCFYSLRKFRINIHALAEHYFYKITLISLIQFQISAVSQRMRGGGEPTKHGRRRCCSVLLRTLWRADVRNSAAARRQHFKLTSHGNQK